jgi:predicted nucleic acid-binding protein
VIVIVDASVAVKWIAPEEGQPAALELIRTSDKLCAPEFLLLEVGNTIWKKVRRGELSSDQASGGLGFLRRVIQRFVPDTLLADRALAISLEGDHPIYDCLYVACAEHENGVVVTADTRLLTKLGGRYDGILQQLGALH